LQHKILSFTTDASHLTKQSILKNEKKKIREKKKKKTLGILDTRSAWRFGVL